MKIMLFTLDNCPYSKRVEEKLTDLGFLVRRINSKARGESLPSSALDWRGDLIIFYSGYFILPPQLLKKCNYHAINFHPAPPEYPGSGCASWALYKNSSSYGITLHLMNDGIDNGKILECRRFPILPEDNLKTLIDKTKFHQFNFFSEFVDHLASVGINYLQKESQTNLAWSGHARKISEIDELQAISAKCSKEELEKIIRATHSERFPVKARIHGYDFILKL